MCLIKGTRRAKTYEFRVPEHASGSLLSWIELPVCFFTGESSQYAAQDVCAWLCVPVFRRVCYFQLGRCKSSMVVIYHARVYTRQGFSD